MLIISYNALLLKKNRKKSLLTSNRQKYLVERNDFAVGCDEEFLLEEIEYSSGSGDQNVH